MKPIGPIPAGYGCQADELMVAGRRASVWAAELGTPCFVYGRDRIGAQVAQLRHALPPGVTVHYAVKANPFPPLLEALRPLVDGLDVASSGELAHALAAGFAGEDISFAGPGKRDAEIEAAIRAGATLNLESEGEAARVLAAATRLGRRPHLAVRVNPDFEVRGAGLRMGGGARPFGVDAECVAPLVKRLLGADADWRGLHFYPGTQSLDAAAIAEGQRRAIESSAVIAAEVGVTPPLVNLGGGFGLAYFAGDWPLDVDAVGRALQHTLDARPAALSDTRFALELGRWLVGEAGVYLTRIVDRKESRGETFLVTDGGMNHQLAATGNLGSLTRRTYPLAIATRFGATADEVATIVGPLCTPLDRLADRAALPHADVGDLVAVFMAGAYGASASPAGFLGHPPAAEILA